MHDFAFVTDPKAAKAAADREWAIKSVDMAADAANALGEDDLVRLDMDGRPSYARVDRKQVLKNGLVRIDFRWAPAPREA